MGVRVVVRDGESVNRAMWRLKVQLKILYRRRAIKGRNGDHYVKPCEIRRRLEYEKRCWRLSCKYQQT